MLIDKFEILCYDVINNDEEITPQSKQLSKGEVNGRNQGNV